MKTLLLFLYPMPSIFSKEEFFLIAFINSIIVSSPSPATSRTARLEAARAHPDPLLCQWSRVRAACRAPCAWSAAAHLHRESLKAAGCTEEARGKEAAECHPRACSSGACRCKTHPPAWPGRSPACCLGLRPA